MAGEITQLTPQGIGPYFEILPKTDSGVVDLPLVTDIVRPRIVEVMPFDIELEVYEYVVPRLTESVSVIRMPPVQIDIVVPRVVDVAAPVVIIGPPGPPTLIQAFDTVLPLIDDVGIAEPTVTVAVDINSSDTVIPVLVESATVQAPVVKTASETIVPSIFEQIGLVQIAAFQEWEVADTVVPGINDSLANVQTWGDVDAIVITSRPLGYIQISET